MMLQTHPLMRQPRCPTCGAMMDRANVIPGLGEWGHRLFQCERCGKVELLARDHPAAVCQEI